MLSTTEKLKTSAGAYSLHLEEPSSRRALMAPLETTGVYTVTNDCLMDVEEIRERLPHRYPFLLVDRVVELTPGDSIVAYKNLTINEPFFDGHFPGNAVFPGVLLVEAMAQAAGVLGFKTMDKTPADGSIYMFVGADNLRFKRPCVPGDRVYLHAKILGERRGIWKFGVKAEVDSQLCASATILCADRPA